MLDFVIEFPEDTNKEGEMFIKARSPAFGGVVAVAEATLLNLLDAVFLDSSVMG
eukprot:CAMPEP_0115045420 /NCGR_PEP_ID=MMETSP0216-20121206/48140_1 /TAXON_ID=223996 /ORGANISM="Protocruzia adherens, Strain Boccale" /LENGTH=53 /DNA_ID=CAMNT_0002428301 /DNA_START=253 /DNA_END=411 /DNA_ORIENTATION=-